MISGHLQRCRAHPSNIMKLKLSNRSTLAAASVCLMATGCAGLFTTAGGGGGDED